MSDSCVHGSAGGFPSGQKISARIRGFSAGLKKLNFFIFQAKLRSQSEIFGSLLKKKNIWAHQERTVRNKKSFVSALVLDYTTFLRMSLINTKGWKSRDTYPLYELHPPFSNLLFQVFKAGTTFRLRMINRVKFHFHIVDRGRANPPSPQPPLIW